jgi:molybdopterin-binding protein
MNDIVATISQIKSHDSVHIVKFDIDGVVLSMMSLELDERYRVGSRVKLVVKPTHIAISKRAYSDISYSNQLQATIVSIENGILLSSIKLRFLDIVLESIITLESSKRLELSIGDSVVAYIKASEISIGEIVDA